MVASFSNYSRANCQVNITQFPFRLHDILDQAQNQDFQHIISWMPDGQSFKIHDPESLMPILSRFGLKQSRWKSFLRQLQNYGFQRELRGPEKGLCRHELFVRGRGDLCLEMRRIKKSYSSENLRGISPLTIPRLLNDSKFSTTMPYLQDASFNSGIRRSGVAWSAGSYTQNAKVICAPLMPRPILGPAPFNNVLRPLEKRLRTENMNGSLIERSLDEMDTLFMSESSLEETFSREFVKV